MKKVKDDSKAFGKTAPTSVPASNDDWETKGHMNTLLDAHEIMNDPHKIAKVKKMVGRHKKAINSLRDLKDVANNYSNMKDEDGDE